MCFLVFLVTFQGCKKRNVSHTQSTDDDLNFLNSLQDYVAFCEENVGPLPMVVTCGEPEAALVSSLSLDEYQKALENEEVRAGLGMTQKLFTDLRAHLEGRDAHSDCVNHRQVGLMCNHNEYVSVVKSEQSYFVTQCQATHAQMISGHYARILAVHHNTNSGYTCFYDGRLSFNPQKGTDQKIVNSPKDNSIYSPIDWRVPELANCVGCHEAKPLVLTSYMMTHALRRALNLPHAALELPLGGPTTASRKYSVVGFPNPQQWRDTNLATVKGLSLQVSSLGETPPKTSGQLSDFDVHSIAKGCTETCHSFSGMSMEVARGIFWPVPILGPLTHFHLYGRKTRHMGRDLNEEETLRVMDVLDACAKNKTQCSFPREP